MRIFKVLIIFAVILSLVSCTRKVVTTPIHPEPVVIAEEVPREMAPATVVNIVEPIMFAYDSDVIESAEIAKIDKIVDLMKAYADTNIAIKGFASEEGTAEYNMELAGRRAGTVKAAIMEAGITEDRIITIINGATIEFGSLLELNRRVLVISIN